MNKKNLLSIAALTAAISISATLSFFSDREQTKENGFKAGSLDLSLEENSNGQTAEILDNRTWLPGDEIEGSIDLQNTGTLPIEEIVFKTETETTN